MNEFHLEIVTPDGMFFDGNAEKVIVRTVTGDIGILAHHANFLAPIGVGKARITCEGKTRDAACVGGLISVNGNVTRIVASTFEWADEIDIDRAKRAAERAQTRLEKKTAGMDIQMAEMKLKRALNRINVYQSR